MSPYNSFVCGPKFTKLFSPNVEWVVVDQVFSRCSICRSLSEIFAIKVESCQKSRQNFDIFWPSQFFFWGGLPKVVRALSPLPHGTSPGKRFCEDTPISPEVLVAHTLNFKPYFKFSRLKFFWGTPVPVVVCANKAWSICNACKNLRGQHPPKAEM